MKILYNILVALFVIGAIVSCSKLQEPITPAADISTHGDGNVNPASPNFHGLMVAQNVNGWSDCRQCHGSDLSGGTAPVSCSAASCHPTFNVHVEGILDTGSQDFHGNFLRLNNWNLPDCKNCHGNDYSGGVASPTCISCHTQPNGPEACNTCHGDFDNGNFIAPPQDTNNNIDTKFSGVGAHKIHLYDNDLGNMIECSTCHLVPDNITSDGHIDQNLRAEIIFGNVAISNIANDPDYSFDNITCSNIYCHGNFEFLKADAPANHQFAFVEGADRMIGNNISVVWNNVDSSQAVCGSCHNLPPVGHIEANLSACGTCHSGIFDRDGNIVDSLSYKHINGEINVSF